MLSLVEPPAVRCIFCGREEEGPMTGEATWLTLLLPLLPFSLFMGGLWFFTRRSLRHAHH